jgi:hypothetical protein
MSHFFTTIVLALLVTQPAHAVFDCTNINPKSTQPPTTPSNVTDDFGFRDSLPQTEIPKEKWHSCCGSFGPCPITYPSVNFSNPNLRIDWSRKRVIEAAKKLIGTPYAHRHIPAMNGLDCSNFTAFVYNYSLGIRFNSNVERQAEEAGRRLEANAPLAPGDIIYIYDGTKSRIAHAVIYIDKDNIIDDTGPGVKVRAFVGWYKERQAWARRIIE